MALSLNGIRLSKISPAFLHGNSTSHTWPFSGIAELIDNAYDPDVNASELWIDKRVINKVVCLTFVDNGNGMDQEKLHKMLSFGFCEKVQVGKIKPVGHYGNGFKSGSMRLGKDALVFTRTEKSMSVGFLSQTYLTAINAETVIVPIVTWSLPDNTRPNNEVTNNNLRNILKYSLIHSEPELLAELNSIEKLKTGTNIIIYNLKRDRSDKLELDFDSDKLDIRNPETHMIDLTSINRPVHTASPEYKRSLREYCSILYLKPRMKIILRGVKVKTKLIYKSLSQTEIDPYKPTWLDRPVRIIFGFTASREPESYGLLMYHKNRLIKAYEKIGCQKNANEQGVGVVGVVEADFLEPIHNKQDFNRTDKYSSFMNSVAIKLNDYWMEKTHGTSRAREKEQQLPDWTWVQCDNCLKWRRMPSNYKIDLPEKWFCYLNPDASFNRCDIAEEPEDDDEALQASYKKTFKKREEERRKQVKVEELNRTAQKEQQLRMREEMLSKKMFEMQRQSATLEVSSSQDRTQRKPTVADLEQARKSLDVYKRRLVEQQQTIQELETQKKEIEQQSREMEAVAKKLQVSQNQSKILMANVNNMAGTSSAIVSSSSGPSGKKRRAASTMDSGGKIFIKTEEGESVTVERTDNDPNADIIDLTDPDEHEIKPDPSLLIKQGSSKEERAKVLVHRCAQTVPVMVKFASQDEVDLMKLSPIERKQLLVSKDRELKETKQTLTSLRENICHLLKIIVPDFDYGAPEKIEEIILDFIRVNGESNEDQT